MSILFITNRNIINTCGELRLIKNRALALQQEYGIETEFLVFRSNKCQKRPQEEIGGNSSLEKYLYKDKNVFSFIHHWNAFKKRIFHDLKKNDYKTIVLSGNLVFGFAKKIKRQYPQIKIVFDVHGAVEELIEFGGKGKISSIYKRMLFHLFKRKERKYMKYADGLFVVSKTLQQYLIKEYKIEDKAFFLVPCAQNQYVLDKCQKQENREKYRKKYGIESDERLFIYSGGLSAWQCVDETVKLFKEIQSTEKNCKLLLLTGNVEAIRHYEGDGIIVDSLPFTMVNDVICAGDFAFLLREDFVTNNVAYPNKFIEYVASGMKIIAMPYVKDVASQIEEYGVGIVFDKNKERLLRYVHSENCYMEDINSRQALLDDVCFENRLKPFIAFINEGII